MSKKSRKVWKFNDKFPIAKEQGNGIIEASK